MIIFLPQGCLNHLGMKSLYGYQLYLYELSFLDKELFRLAYLKIPIAQVNLEGCARPF